MDHDLEYPWTLYVTKQRTVQGFEKSTKEWEDRLEKIHTITTAESFWSVFNNLRLPSEMKNERGDFYLFKNSILPEWEHPKNLGGGSLLLSADPNRVDDLWIRLQLFIIGSNLEDSEVICGLELAIRKNRFKVAVWVLNAPTVLIRNVAEQLKQATGTLFIEYRKHDSTDKAEFTLK